MYRLNASMRRIKLIIIINPPLPHCHKYVGMKYYRSGLPVSVPSGSGQSRKDLPKGGLLMASKDTELRGHLLAERVLCAAGWYFTNRCNATRTRVGVR